MPVHCCNKYKKNSKVSHIPDIPQPDFPGTEQVAEICRHQNIRQQNKRHPVIHMNAGHKTADRTKNNQHLYGAPGEYFQRFVLAWIPEPPVTVPHKDIPFPLHSFVFFLIPAYPSLNALLI